jgi:hypothetical protein
MGIALFLLMLSLPLGVLITVGPPWAEPEPPLPLPAPTAAAAEEPGLDAIDSSHHPATCLAIATHRARAYLGFVAARWHLDELDPMTWLVAGRLRDRFETAMLDAIGALHDWLGSAPPFVVDPRGALERERIRETLTELVRSLPTFPVDLGRGCHYPERDLSRICGQLGTLAAAIERHRQAALHPPPSPFR